MSVTQSLWTLLRETVPAGQIAGAMTPCEGAPSSAGGKSSYQTGISSLMRSLKLSYTAIQSTTSLFSPVTIPEFRILNGLEQTAEVFLVTRRSNKVAEQFV